VQRVGPLTSTGAYDWWQMSGRDTAFLSEALSTQPSGAIYLVESFVGARGARMEPLPYPPIHVHHVHLSPSIETLRYHGTGISSLPYKQQLAIERHGEWTRLGLPGAMEGGMATELEPEGYGRRISFPLVMDAEINDARVANSDPLIWCMEFAVRWMPGIAPLKPLTVTNVINTQAPLFGLQSTYEAYFFVEPYKPVISWYTATMGPHVQRQRVLYVKSHTHMNLLKKWLLFDSPPEALLGPSSFLTKFPASYPPSRTELLHDTMHANDGIPPGQFMANQWPLARTEYSSWEAFEAALMAGPAGETLLCTFTPNYLKTADAWYDRAVDATCRGWTLEPGRVLSSVAMLSYDCVPGGAPGVCPIEPWLDDQLPSRGFPMHIELFIMGEVLENATSCFSTDQIMSYADDAGGLHDLTLNRGQRCAVGVSGNDPTVSETIYSPGLDTVTPNADGHAAVGTLYRIRASVVHTLAAAWSVSAPSTVAANDASTSSRSLRHSLSVSLILLSVALWVRMRRGRRRCGYDEAPTVAHV